MIRLHAVRNMAGEMGQISNMTSRYFAPMNIKSKRDRPTILLVEDSPTQRIVVSKMIQELGFNILGAGDGKEALHMALQHQPALILGSSQITGEGGSDLQEEVLSVSIAIPHAFHQFDLIIHSLQATGVEGVFG